MFQTPYADGFKALTGGHNFFLGMGNTADYQRDTSNMRIVVRRDDLGRIATISGQSADRLVAAAPGRLDVVTLAQQVAMDFVAEYFGVASSTPDTIASASAAISGYLFLSADNLGARANCVGEVLTLLRDTLAERKLDRGKHDDVLERCLVLQDAGVPGMDEETLLVNLFGLVVGAIPTTVAMAARAVDELLDRPDELALAHTAAAAGDAATVVAIRVRGDATEPARPRRAAQRARGLRDRQGHAAREDRQGGNESARGAAVGDARRSRHR